MTIILIYSFITLSEHSKVYKQTDVALHNYLEPDKLASNALRLWDITNSFSVQDNLQ